MFQLFDQGDNTSTCKHEDTGPVDWKQVGTDVAYLDSLLADGELQVQTPCGVSPGSWWSQCCRTGWRHFWRPWKVMISKPHCSYCVRLLRLTMKPSQEKVQRIVDVPPFLSVIDKL